MKIEFLNEELTKVRLTRGFWWWKRVAWADKSTTQTVKIYRRYQYLTIPNWHYSDTDEPLYANDCSDLYDEAEKITTKRAAEVRRIEEAKVAEQDRKFWGKPTKLPEARIK